VSCEQTKALDDSTVVATQYDELSRSGHDHCRCIVELRQTHATQQRAWQRQLEPVVGVLIQPMRTFRSSECQPAPCCSSSWAVRLDTTSASKARAGRSRVTCSIMYSIPGERRARSGVPRQRFARGTPVSSDYPGAGSPHETTTPFAQSSDKRERRVSKGNKRRRAWPWLTDGRQSKAAGIIRQQKVGITACQQSSPVGQPLKSC
jgi:hypothetical protein